MDVCFKMHLSKRILHFAFLLITTSYLVNCQGDDGYSYSKFLNDEGRLYRHLLNESHYEPSVRPAEKADSPATRLEFGMNLVQLMGLDEERQVIEILGWIKKAWNDSRLAWNPEDFGGITQMRLPHDKIWRPDFVIFNGAFEAGESSGFGHIYEAMAVVYSNGYVSWIPPVRIKASCQLDISDFPFDKQNCSLKFGSWTYSSEFVNPQFFAGQADFDYTYYKTNNVWELEKTYAVRHDTKYACCKETYPDLTFSLQLKRRRSYYSYMLVLPGIIMALLLPIMFLLPVGRPEKFYLGCTLLICLTLLTLLLEMIVPTAHSGVPFIEAYYLANFIITGISLAISTTILNISRFTSQPPQVFRRIIGMCAKCCCIDMPGHVYKNFKIQMNTRSDENPIAMDQDGFGATPNSDWMVIATVMDRFFLVCSVIVALLVTIGMASHG